jgi:hypothetical protein
MVGGRGARIFNRPCRTEKVKTARTYSQERSHPSPVPHSDGFAGEFLVYYKTVKDITMDEVAKAIVPYGLFEIVESVSLVETHARPQNAIKIQFGNFDITRELRCVSFLFWY